MRKRFRDWDRWLVGDARPTVNQAQDLAAFTHVPFGMLMLPEPPEEHLPIPDFRSGPEGHGEPSQELLQTVYLAQNRQAWFEDYLVRIGADPVEFVGSAMGMSAEEAAALISDALGYGPEDRSALRDASRARKYLVQTFESLGGLVSVSSMVGNDTHRPLDRDEFRGFALHSDLAPYVFVNAKDTKPGQVFSLLHEFAHVWRGETGVSDAEAMIAEDRSPIEKWCDQVAAEIAVPRRDLAARADMGSDLTEELERLASVYKCSTLVVLIQMRTARLLQREGFNALYEHEVSRLMGFIAQRSATKGGDFYSNQPLRISERLSQALISDTRRGDTALPEAMRLMGLGSVKVFDKYVDRLEGR
ncbi:ImmA/IrrE family metallo-endopeptidase [Acidipropionibacterium acidipropionici]|jgi:Zn-dependent peptidase ImmA (M78 family)|nr:ImmA/IrrE family metallo-endopeptidase [Acidipropionibacterium acidipropionici]